MAAAPTVSHVTAKQRAADVANLKKARAVAGKLPRTAKQKAASRQNLVRARAAQKARRSGKKFAPSKKPAAPLSPETAPSLHLLPVCAAVAIAEHLAAFTGVTAPDAAILALAAACGGGCLGDYLAAAAVTGLAGYVLDTWARCDEEQDVPGLVYGLTVPGGYHAVLGHPAGVISWGRVLPWPAAPAEAWHLEWRAA